MILHIHYACRCSSCRCCSSKLLRYIRDVSSPSELACDLTEVESWNILVTICHWFALKWFTCREGRSHQWILPPWRSLVLKWIVISVSVCSEFWGRYNDQFCCSGLFYALIHPRCGNIKVGWISPNVFIWVWYLLGRTEAQTCWETNTARALLDRKLDQSFTKFDWKVETGLASVTNIWTLQWFWPNRNNIDRLLHSMSEDYVTSLKIGYLWYAVVYEDWGDGDVAADPVRHIRPVLPERVSVVLHPTALDTKPARGMQ